MCEIKLLHKYLSESLPEVHTARLTSVMCAVENALIGNKVTVAGLGRACINKVQVKNNIKRMDRLVGNKILHKEVKNFYRVIANMIIGNKKHPIILVDWATVDNRDKYRVLKASIAYEGRAITIYT